MSDRKPVSEYAMPHLRKLSGYTPGFQPKEPGWIKLNTNECPYGPSSKVEAALHDAIGESMRLYPDPPSAAVREEAAKLHSLSPENVIVGNGSDDLLNLLARAFAGGGGGASCAVPSYSLYPVLCAIENANLVEIPFDRSMALPVDALAKSNARILFFTSPNAPTGVGFATEDLAKVAEAFDGIVVIDEAYADFAEENAVALLADFTNVVITRTFSKSYALAGLRIGYALADAEVIRILDAVRDSYNVNRLSQVAALAALQDQNHLVALVGKVKRTRDFYQEEFESMGWFAYPSQANFLFVEPRGAAGNSGPEVAKALFEFLKSRQILVRYFGGHALTDSFLRISVGDESQMLSLSETIQEWLKNA